MSETSVARSDVLSWYLSAHSTDVSASNETACPVLSPFSCSIGGEYPLSATISSEAASTKDRGKNVSLVFAMQGWGNLTAGALGWALLKGCQHLDVDRYTIVWRTMLAFGGLPGLLTVYFRYQMEESKIFSKSVQGIEDDDQGGGSVNGGGRGQALLGD